MNLSQLRLKLRSRIGNPSLSDVADSVLNDPLNTAYMEIADRFRFHNVRKLCKFNTIIDTTNYGIPSDCLAVLSVRDLTNAKKLTKSDSRRSFEKDPAAESGFPCEYTRFKNWIELLPAPSGVFEIEMYYKAIITEMSADTDSPVLNIPWHEGILRLAKYYYYTDVQNDLPKAIESYNAYDVWAQTKPVEVDEEKVDFDSGVSVPTLSEWTATRLDFNHSE